MHLYSWTYFLEGDYFCYKVHPLGRDNIWWCNQSFTSLFKRELEKKWQETADDWGAKINVELENCIIDIRLDREAKIITFTEHYWVPAFDVRWFWNVTQMSSKALCPWISMCTCLRLKQIIWSCFSRFLQSPKIMFPYLGSWVYLLCAIGNLNLVSSCT